jgi:hypothetical protein
MTEKMSSELYDIYKRLHEWEKEALLQASITFDKSIITLSSTLLGFIFAIIRFTGHKPLVYLFFIKTSFVLAVVAIIATLASFLCDQEHTVRSIDHIQNILSTKVYSERKPHCVDNWMRWFGFLALAFFILAILSFAVFALANF